MHSPYKKMHYNTKEKLRKKKNSEESRKTKVKI